MSLKLLSENLLKHIHRYIHYYSPYYIHTILLLMAGKTIGLKSKSRFTLVTASLRNIPPRSVGGSKSIFNIKKKNSTSTD